MAELRYGVDERPSHGLSAALGLQTVALIVAGIVLVPVIVLRAANGDAEMTSWAIFAALAVSGFTTIVQARPLGSIGAGYLLFMGTSGAFLAVATSAVHAGGLPLLATLVIVSSAVEFLLASRLSVLRRIVTPTVGGAVVMLIAVAVFPICIRMLGTLPETAEPTSFAGPITAGTTFLTVLIISLFGTPKSRLWAPLIGIIVGCIVAYSVGLMSFTAVREAPWIGLPAARWPGLDLSFDADFFILLPAFVIVTLIGAIETYGDGIAIQRISSRTERPVDFRSVQGALKADGLGNLLSGLLGTLPNTTYSTSISVVELTGVASRRVGIYGGAMLVALAFLPKISALLQAVPDAVGGAYLLILIVLLFAHGLRLVTEGGLSYENGLVVCLSFWLGLGFQEQSIFPDHFHPAIRTIVDNGMTAGGLVAILLTSLLSLKNRGSKPVQLEHSLAALPRLQELTQRVATDLGWDASAIDRLQLAAEEALVFLLERAEDMNERDRLPIIARIRPIEGDVELELATGPGAANIEEHLADLSRAEKDDAGAAGLRILQHVATEVHHAHFQDRAYLSVRVDSRPLT
jgi:xanthine permease XanP